MWHKKPKYVYKIFLLFIIICLLEINVVLAQPVDSSNYQLTDFDLSILGGEAESTNYAQLISSETTAGFTDSSTYRYLNSTADMVEPFVPEVLCFETNSNAGSTNCNSLPGSDGMNAVCTSEGCYDRAKIEINGRGNAEDVGYLIQISTDPTFASNVYYVDGTTRLLKSNFGLSDFLPKCEWEGTVAAGVCGAANPTWQKYNILGLAASTQYYARVAALHGTDTDGSFTQTEWGPSNTATTTSPSITLDVDIASDAATETSPPHNIDFGTVNIDVVNTASNLIVFDDITSNATNGLNFYVLGEYGGLYNSADNHLLSSVNGDLAGPIKGFGLRNQDTTNSADLTTSLGDISISSTPSTFTDTGGPHAVGQVPTTYVKLFDTQQLPVQNGQAGFELKMQADVADPAGNYSETFTFLASGAF